ncbi:hypothetical protein MRX96_053977, partial [Rhipicephalus microplus]
RLLGDAGGLLGAQVASLAELDEYLPMLVMGCLALLGGVVLFLLPETVGTAMPQTIEGRRALRPRPGELWLCPLFTTNADEPAQDKSPKTQRLGISSFHKKMPVTGQPEVNKAFFRDDESVVATIYNSVR